jgi:HD-GYP domain-containing protein (c-di-GMP phosphodiesterase class II)
MNKVSIAYEHADRLKLLDHNVSLSEKFVQLHFYLRDLFPFAVHISCALYDPVNDAIKTYISSNGGSDPLVQYEVCLSDTPSLMEIVERGSPRVINDLSIFSDSTLKHSQSIKRRGYKASYTVPMYRNQHFVGFIFINSDEKEVFTENLLHQVDPIVRLIKLTVLAELCKTHTLLASLKTARDLTQARDDETGAHLNRMSRYSQLIARSVADKYDLSDEYIEKIYIFSPLHDIGKIAIPDRLLLKPGKLSEAEFSEMKTHTIKGWEIVKSMLANFELEAIPFVEVLHNIIELHHEKVDGSGYPQGLAGSEIPIEALIVAVADIFDAFTSKRPYKEAWDNEKAFAELRKLAGVKLDASCVEALINEEDTIRAIQVRFKEDPL